MKRHDSWLDMAIMWVSIATTALGLALFLWEKWGLEDTVMNSLHQSSISMSVSHLGGVLAILGVAGFLTRWVR